LARVRTLVWNGPFGAFEKEPFDTGTIEVAEAAAELTQAGKLVSVAGGGDTVAALNAAGVTSRLSYVSAAGGAFLEWLEGKVLPGVEGLRTRAARKTDAASSGRALGTRMTSGGRDEPRRTAQDCVRDGNARQGPPGRGRILRHDQEALRCGRNRVDARKPARLSRAAVPLERGDVEIRVGRHSLRRDDPAESQRRHRFGCIDPAVWRHPRHQGRQGLQAAGRLPRRTGDGRPRRSA